MRRTRFLAGSLLVLIVAACSDSTSKTAPTQPVKVNPVKIECRNGVVIHWGADGKPDTTCAGSSLRAR